ncbi:hypothetical protein GCM10028895_02170 [Pontibacter rugosus]
MGVAVAFFAVAAGFCVWQALTANNAKSILDFRGIDFMKNAFWKAQVNHKCVILLTSAYSPYVPAAQREAPPVPFRTGFRMKPYYDTATNKP